MLLQPEAIGAVMELTKRLKPLRGSGVIVRLVRHRAFRYSARLS